MTASDPIISPDGEWLWTGEEWIPAPPSSASAVSTVEAIEETESARAALTAEPPLDTTAATQTNPDADVPRRPRQRSLNQWVIRQAWKVHGLARAAFGETDGTRTYYKTTHGLTGSTTRQKEEMSHWSFFMLLVGVALYVVFMALIVLGLIITIVELPLRKLARIVFGIERQPRL